MPNLLYIFYIIKLIVELFIMNIDFILILSCQAKTTSSNYTVG